MPHVPDAPRWKLVGGALCLDFVNTVGGRRAPARRDRNGGSEAAVITERLVAYEDLLSWGEAAGALPRPAAARLQRAAAHQPARARSVLTRATTLRETLFEIFAAAGGRDSPSPEHLRTLNRELAIAGAHERLAVESPAFAWGWTDDGEALDRPLWPIARSAANLLTSPALGRVRRCAGEDCGWLFLDTTRNHSRQWCDMRDCGNRAKVRRFRQRAGQRG